MDGSALETTAPQPTPSWQDQDDLLREMWLRNQPPDVIAETLGRSVAAIMTRAVRLGLPRRAAPGRKPGRRPPPSASARSASVQRARSMATPDDVAVNLQPANRVCLMCLRMFSSEGRHNRICPTCKGSAEYVKASSVPDIAAGVSV